MEEDKIKDLFTDFKPELSSDFAFMTKLQHSLDQVEMIRQHNAELARKRKISVVIAGCVGFVVGFLFSLALPYIATVMQNLQASLPTDSTLKLVADNYLTVAWLIIAATTVFISLNTYDLSFSLLKSKT